MRRASILRFHRRTQGQSIIETALLMPIMLLIAFNAINFGYFFFVAVNLAAAPRSGVQYSILGFATPGGPGGPPAIPPRGPSGSSCPSSTTTIYPYVCSVVYEDILGALYNATNATVRVCSSNAGGGAGTSGSGSATVTTCTTYGGGTISTGPQPDPEAPLFKLARVDIQYTVTPIIPAFQLPTPAGPISLTILPNLNFRRQVSMREMD